MMKWLFALLCVCCSLSANDKPTIILDPGHGGKDEGANIYACVEKKLTLRTSYLTKKHLEGLGYRVVLTRARDIYLPLQTRVTIANKRSPSLFVSIHYNSSKSPEAKGIEVYYYNTGEKQRNQHSKKLAQTILGQLVKETECRSRGIKRGNFHVIRETEMPAVLVEAGFLTNLEERNLLSTHTYLDKIAKGIALGIDKYLR